MLEGCLAERVPRRFGMGLYVAGTMLLLHQGVLLMTKTRMFPPAVLPPWRIKNMYVRAGSVVGLFLFAAIGLGCSDPKTSTEAPTASDPWITLFDGTSTDGWAMTGPGVFRFEDDGSITAQGGMGLYYYKDLMLKDFVLELEWKSTVETANSGVFVRFPDAPDPWYAVNTGYEIQIDDSRDPLHRTGSIFGMAPSSELASKPLGEWNRYRIEVTGQRYVVYLNGERVNDFTGDRSLEGMIGLQNHDDDSPVSFRNIRVLPLPETTTPTSQSVAMNRPAGPETGEELYQTRCVSCHMPEGQGVPGVNPPLAGSAYVAGDTGQLIRIVLNGLRGERTIGDVTYNGVMPPWSGLLDDTQLAALLTFVRSNFGNASPAITIEEVARVRAAVGDRTAPWTVEELDRIESSDVVRMPTP